MAETYARHPQLAGRVVGDLAFVVTANDNRLITLNSTATWIWELLAVPQSAEDVTALLCKEFEVSAAQAKMDVEECLQDLVERQILVRLE